MMEVTVLPRMLVEGKTFDDDTLVISIKSPGKQSANIVGKHVYVFELADIRLEHIDAGVVDAHKAVYTAIGEVIVQHKDKKKLVCHCEAGISRSPAIVIGMSRYINVSPDESILMKLYPHHNTYIRKWVEKGVRDALIRIGENPYASY